VNEMKVDVQHSRCVGCLGDHLVLPATLRSSYPYTSDGGIRWTGETPYPDPWVSIAAMATATRYLRFTTAVYIAPLRDPFTVAKATSTVSVLSHGRVSCGFGAGWMREEFDLVGLDFAGRGSRLDEMIEVLRLLWSGEMVEFHGRHFDFAPVQMSPPALGRVPVLIGGNTRSALERAVRNDGWIGVHRGVDQTAALVDTLRTMRGSDTADDPTFQIAVVVLRGAGDAAPLADLGVDSAIIPVLGLEASADLNRRVDAIKHFGDSMLH